jgi:hypothetical protein
MDIINGFDYEGKDDNIIFFSVSLSTFYFQQMEHLGLLLLSFYLSTYCSRFFLFSYPLPLTSDHIFLIDLGIQGFGLRQ